MSFRSIPSQPQYEINPQGVVRTRKTGRVLRVFQRNEYLAVALGSRRALQKLRSLHRLLAETFIPNPEGLPTVNHINGNKFDNRLENLEWSSHTRNLRHAYLTGLNRPAQGEASHASKLTSTQVQQVRQLLAEGVSQYRVAQRFGVSRGCIQAIHAGNSWSGGGNKYCKSHLGLPE
jgi:hypothetical protein